LKLQSVVIAIALITFSSNRTGAAAVVAYPSNLTKPDISSSPKAESVEASLTWHANEIQGSKGDEGAVLLLFSEQARHRITVGDVSFFKGEIIPWRYKAMEGPSLSLRVRRSLRSIGIYAGEADGYGGIIIDEVPLGKYVVLGLSNHASSFVSDLLSTDIIEALRPLFASQAALHAFEINPAPPARAIVSFKPFVDEIIVRGGRSTKLTHDFGSDRPS
jgi:hypothetical protein